MYLRLIKLTLTMVLAVVRLEPGLFAQHYNFISYSTESGLAQSQVRALAQDKKGYLWLGTMGGLSRYDGKKFLNYSIQNGLIDNQVFSLYADRSIGLWIGTMGGINYFDGNTFTSFLFKDEMSENMVNAIAQDSNGDLWLATDGAGVCRLRQGKFEYFTEKDGLIGNMVRAVCIDDKGLVWFGTRNGVSYFDGVSFRSLDTAIAQPRNVSDIFVDRKQQLWFCTFGEGAFKYDGKNFLNYNETHGLINNWIRSAIEDEDGNIWFASKFGICKFDGKRFQPFTEANGLPADNSNVMFEDGERNIWIGSDGKGLCKFLGETFTYLTTKDRLSSNIVLSIVEDKENDLWFSTFGKGITRKHDTVNTYYTNENGLPNNIVWASLRDRNQKLWFCTSDGVSMFDGSTFRNYSINDGLSARIVYAVCEDHRGRLWFGTSAGVSVFEKDSFTNYLNGRDNIGKGVANIVEDRNHALWFATKNGLYCFKDNVFRKYTTADGLSNNNLYSLAVDAQNNLWIGTRAGLNYYDGKRFRKVPIDDAFTSNYVCFLIRDRKNTLWIGTNSGVYTLDIQAYQKTGNTKFRHYTIFDGLPGMECNQNSAFQDHLGKIWMGTTNGIIRHDPETRNFHNNDLPPSVHISGVRLFLKDTNWRAFTDNIDSASHLPRNLSVNYTTNHFTFDFVGIKLSNPNAVRYRYMLEGFDDAWSAPTDANFATYSNLPSGKYTFKVVTGETLGAWNTTPATFSFEIRPPFWTQWWFVLLCLLLVVVLVWVVFRLRVNEIRKKHLTQQLEYKSKLMLLEHQSLNSSMNRHFIFNALNSIQYYINNEDKLAAHKYLSRFAKLIRMNLDSSMNKLVPVSEEISRLDLYLQIELMRFSDRFTYNITIADDVDPDSIDIPPMLLQPYVENSILHGILPSNKKGQIDIRVEQDASQHIIFSIQDNGIGIEESIARKAAKHIPHVSRGTSITTQRIQLLVAMENLRISINGPFEMKNPEGGVLGTRVELIIH
jgi:ligand-binding sensor domain-containing protein/signal transduction histidine kinase